MSIQVRLSWTEHFMNWYPRNTKLYRRRSKSDSPDTIKQMSVEFDELKPFFAPVEKMSNDLVAARAEVTRLRKAIEKHKAAAYGPVINWDLELWAALEKDEGTA